MFLVQRRALEGRLNPIHYIKTGYELQDYILLKDVLKDVFQGETQGDKDLKKGIGVLKVKNIKLNGEISYDGISFCKKIRQRKILEFGDILTPFRGMAIFNGKYGFYNGNSSSHTIDNNLGVIRIDQNKYNPKFLQIFFKTNFGRTQFFKFIGITSIPAITKEIIQKFRIPTFSLSIQEQIVKQYQTAYNTKAQKENEAQILLKSIDNYLLETLDIQIASSVEIKKSFFVKWSQVSNSRFDPAFYKESYLQIIKAIKATNHKALGNLINFSSESWNGADYFNITFPYIEISEIDLKHGFIRKIKQIPISEAPSRAKMIIRNNDILVSTTRPNRGAIALANFGVDEIKIASTGFAVLRKPKVGRLNKSYLFYMLRNKLILTQMEQRSSGGNYPAITAEELKKILIPLPRLETQNDIVQYISNIQKQAQKLKKEAVKILEEAKLEVEKIILGNSKTNE